MEKLIGLVMGVVIAMVVFVAGQAAVDLNDGRVAVVVNQMVNR